MKDEFLATVSHELRTPLNAILGWTRHAARAASSTPRGAQRALETIERNATAQAQLIEDLLDVSRIITGKLRLELQPVELRADRRRRRSTRCARPPRPRASQLDVEARPGRRRRSRGDPDRLQQVVWNLLSNAIKFTPRGRARSTVAPAAATDSHVRAAGDATRARASAPSSCPTSSTASARPTAPPRARTAASAWAWPSCATWSSCTAARWAPRARARARAPRSPCGCRCAVIQRGGRSRASRMRAPRARRRAGGAALRRRVDARRRARARRRRRARRARAPHRAARAARRAGDRGGLGRRGAGRSSRASRPTCWSATSACPARTATR